MNLFGDNLDGYGLSGEVWSKMPLDAILAGNRSVGIGFFDDFLSMSDTTLEDGYAKVSTTNGTVLQIPSDWDPTSAATKVKTGLGICRLLTTAEDNSEAILAAGGGLDAPYKLASGFKDLCFECRVLLTDLTTSSHGFFVGLQHVSNAGVSVQCITAADAIYASTDLIGFQQLKGETTAVDGMYVVSGETKVDGAVNTGLDTLATLVVDTYVKLGFRYRASDRTVHFYVNGVEDTGARLNIATIEAADADSFPDGSFMTPVACLLNDSTTAANLDMDWWACAQVI